MGGRLTAESRPGFGSTFRFTAVFGAAAVRRSIGSEIPAAMPVWDNGPGDVSKGMGAEPRASSFRILIAEDSADNCLLLQAYLKNSRHALTFVGDGETAVNRFLNGEFELILMDIQMPVMDGLTATRKIREIEREQRRVPTPVIALTVVTLLKTIEQHGGHAHGSLAEARDGLLRLAGGQH